MPLWNSVFDNWLDDCKAAFLEFIGTTFFLLLAFGGVQAVSSGTAVSVSTSTSDILQNMYIALCFGFSLLVAVWIFYRATGGVFNPNVSFALFLTGIIGPLRFVLYCIAQLVGGITAAALALGLTGTLTMNTFLADGISHAQGIFIEMFITAGLALSVLMLAAEKHSLTPFAPIGIGLTMFACQLFAVYYTGGVMNVARSFGPAVITGFPNTAHWVYWVGDTLGSLLASAVYLILKHNRYWLLTPGQDAVDHKESDAADPERWSAGRSSVSSTLCSVPNNAVGDAVGGISMSVPQEKRVLRERTVSRERPRDDDCPV